jgi:SprT protein
MVSHEDRVKVAEWARETLAKLGVGEMEDLLTIKWSGRFTSRMGDAAYGYSAYAKRAYVDLKRRRISKREAAQLAARGEPTQFRIRFSKKLWPRASEKERYETVVHEVCHLVAFHMAAMASKRIKPHGPEWQSLMRECGAAPDRCHDIDNSDLRRKPKNRVHATCGCEKGHYLTPYKAGLVAAGYLYTCRACRQSLKVPLGTLPVKKRRRRRRRA